MLSSKTTKSISQVLSQSVTPSFHEQPFVQETISCKVVRAQATVLECSETMPVKLTRPADVGAEQAGTGLAASISVPEAEVHEGDGDGLEQDVVQDETNQQQDDDNAIPFRCAAGEMGSGDLDVERVYKYFAEDRKVWGRH